MLTRWIRGKCFFCRQLFSVCSHAPCTFWMFFLDWIESYIALSVWLGWRRLYLPNFYCTRAIHNQLTIKQLHCTHIFSPTETHACSAEMQNDNECLIVVIVLFFQWPFQSPASPWAPSDRFPGGTTSASLVRSPLRLNRGGHSFWRRPLAHSKRLNRQIQALLPSTSSGSTLTMRVHISVSLRKAF